MKNDFFTIIAVLLTKGCNKNKSEQTEFESQLIETKNLPEEINTLPGIEYGLLQSTINILSDQTEHGELNVTMCFYFQLMTSPFFSLYK